MMPLDDPPAEDATTLPRNRRGLLRLFLGGSLAISAAALAACANRQALPPERRTRGRSGRGEGSSL